MTKLTTGERIKIARERAGMSVMQLAEGLGKNRATVHRYESNEIENIPAEVLIKIGAKVGCPLSFLFGWQDDISICDNWDVNTSDNIIVQSSETKQKDVRQVTTYVKNNGLNQIILFTKENKIKVFDITDHDLETIDRLLTSMLG